MFLSETTRPIRTCAVYAEEREYTSLIYILQLTHWVKYNLKLELDLESFFFYSFKSSIYKPFTPLKKKNREKIDDIAEAASFLNFDIIMNMEISDQLKSYKLKLSDSTSWLKVKTLLDGELSLTVQVS